MKPYWLRQSVGLAVGILFGITGLTGFLGLLGFAVCCEGSALVQKQRLDDDDEDDLDDDDTDAPSRFDGFMPAFGVFLCAWIFSYNLTLS